MHGHGCPVCGKLESKDEIELYEYICSVIGKDNVIKGDRNILNGKEIDILIPSFNIGIEYNGLRWHSESFFKNRQYHLLKTIEAKNKGINLGNYIPVGNKFHYYINIQKMRNCITQFIIFYIPSDIYIERVMHLIILPYIQSRSQGKELWLCLNGWRKNCLFDYHFVAIGEFDESLRTEFPWVEFIYCPTIEKKDNQYNPHLDIQHKMELVMGMFSDKYDGFIRMADDIYAIKPFELEDITTVHYHSLEFIGKKDSPHSYWSHDKWKTRQLLDKENLPHINYTTHYPYWYEFSKLSEIWDKYNMREESYVLEDVYFNYYSHSEPVLDREIRLGIWNKEIHKNEFQNAVDNSRIKFVCNSVEGWSKELENNLEIIE